MCCFVMLLPIPSVFHFRDSQHSPDCPSTAPRECPETGWFHPKVGVPDSLKVRSFSCSVAQIYSGSCTPHSHWAWPPATQQSAPSGLFVSPSCQLWCDVTAPQPAPPQKRNGFGQKMQKLIQWLNNQQQLLKKGLWFGSSLWVGRLLDFTVCWLSNFMIAAFANWDTTVSMQKKKKTQFQVSCCQNLNSYM